MNAELRKAFAELKGRCKTSSQRRAFNEMIKSFSNSESEVESALETIKYLFNKMKPGKNSDPSTQITIKGKGYIIKVDGDDILHVVGKSMGSKSTEFNLDDYSGYLSDPQLVEDIVNFCS